MLSATSSPEGTTTFAAMPATCMIRMGTGFFTPTRILHGPAAVNTEEPQRDRDDFRFYQSHVLCPDGEVFLGQDLLFRHLPEGLDGEDRVQRLVSDIDLRRNKDPYIVEKHLLLPVVDREVSHGWFPGRVAGIRQAQRRRTVQPAPV